MQLRFQQRGKAAFTAVGLFVVSLFLTAYSVKNPGIAGTGAAMLSEILFPFQAISSFARNTTTTWWIGYLELVDAKDENERLRKRLLKLEAENSRLMELESENMRLAGLVNMSGEHKVKGIAARVVGYDTTQWVQTVSIDKGSREGVTVGMSVVQAHGVVGQVISTGVRASKVLLITDQTSGVDAILQSSRARGIISGSSSIRRGLSPGCVLRFVPKDEKVEIGERVITSGMDGVFPKGFLIGVVSDVGSPQDDFMQTIKVTPAVNFSRLEELYVVTAYSEPPDVAPTVLEKGVS